MQYPQAKRYKTKQNERAELFSAAIASIIAVSLLAWLFR